MTQEDKQLLLVDLCGRLPYSPICHIIGENGAEIDDILTTSTILNLDVWVVKPYLRPTSSMTEDELQRYHELCDVDEAVGVGSSIEIIAVHDTPESLDYLNSIHVDYRGLIEQGLAISTEEFNPYKD